VHFFYGNGGRQLVGHRDSQDFSTCVHEKNAATG
jgi:hypothetical protein